VITELLAAGAGVVAYTTPAAVATRHTYARLFTVSRHKCDNGHGLARCGAPAYGRLRFWCGHGHDFKHWACPAHMARQRNPYYWSECGDCVEQDRSGVRLFRQVLDDDGMPPEEAKRAALKRGALWPAFLAHHIVSGVLFGHPVQPKLPYLTDAEVAALERASLQQQGDGE
jgi:hypothetical protein